jgi:dihydrofolate reductase
MELIVAFNEHQVIGKNNTIAWYLPEDLQYFRKMTMKHIIIMGRKTFESFPNGPLKNRIHIVLTNTSKQIEETNQLEKWIDNVYFCGLDGLFPLLEILQTNPTMRTFVIGGSEIYKLLFEYCNTLHITKISKTVEIDETTKFFPFSWCDLYEEFDTVFSGDVCNSIVDEIPFQYITFSRRKKYSNHLI